MSSQFVSWFRSSAPYIRAHRGQSFVIHLAGQLVSGPRLAGIAHDIALLNSLGIRVVIVHGAGVQIEAALKRHGIHTDFVGQHRITPPNALPAIKEAVGATRLEVEALLSMGVTNSPMAGARLRVASGNFITARPFGIRDGVDFAYTGLVRRVDSAAIAERLDDGAIVLISPLGFSPTGEVFNVRASEVAAATAIGLRARKLIFLDEMDPLRDDSAKPLDDLTLEQAKQLVAERCGATDDASDYLARGTHACLNNVTRAHLIDARVEGALLLELFTRDGCGTMVSAAPYDTIRGATIEDVGGILELIEPLERQGVIVRRPREKLETEIHHFMVMERDGAVIGCGALHPWREERIAELACMVTHPTYRDHGRGDQLLDVLQNQARAIHIDHLFVLTTEASHWFKERGFEEATADDLPVARRELYNYARASRVMIKRL